MAISQSTYYGLTRIREMSPDAQDWAVVDWNWDIVSRILKAFEGHTHSGIAGIKYPGYYPVTLTNLITNNSFETNTTGWALHGTSTSQVLSRLTGWATDGTFAMRYQAVHAAGQVGGFTQAASQTIIGNKAYYAAADFNFAVNGTTGTYLKLVWIDAGNATISSSQSTPYTGTGITRLELTATSPALATKCKLEIWTQGTGSPDWRVDSILLSDYGVASPFFNGSITGPGTFQASLVESASGGVLPPGANVAFRLAYVNALGLETDASPENAKLISPAAPPPGPPAVALGSISTPGLGGGTYVYAITLKKGSGETTISSVNSVSVPYDNTYTVNVTFAAAIGSDSVNVYRAIGLNQPFQLLATLAAGVTTYADNGVVPPANVNVQPPTVNTYDANKKIRIDWSSILPHPASAQKLRVYVTQQAGLWSTAHLLSEIDLTTTPPTYLDYLGNETLQTGWPLNISQIPSAPGKLNLSTEATGGFNLTADGNFNSNKALNMVLGTNSVNTNGAVWYDSTTHKVKAYANGAQVDLSPVKALRNEVPDPSLEYPVANSWNTSTTPTITLGSPARTTTTVGGAPGACFQVPIQSWGPSCSLTADVSGFGVQTQRVLPGESIYIFGSVLVPSPIVSANTKIDLQIIWYDFPPGGGGGVTAPTVVTTVNNPTIGSWIDIGGIITVPAGKFSASVQIKVTRLDAGAAIPSTNIYFDRYMLVRGVTSSVPYFDGDSAGAYWTGTVGASPSILGAFQHGVEEGGGHKAENITLGTGNVRDSLARIVDTNTGAKKQVSVPVLVNQETQSLLVNVTTSSTTPVNLNAMTGTIVPEYINQYHEVIFDGEFVLDTVGVALTLTLLKNGSVVVQRVWTCAVANEHLTAHLRYDTIVTDLTAKTYTVQWNTSVGTSVLTAFGPYRKLVIRSVF